MAVSPGNLSFKFSLLMCIARCFDQHDGITLGYMRKQLDHYTMEHRSALQQYSTTLSAVHSIVVVLLLVPQFSVQ